MNGLIAFGTTLLGLILRLGIPLGFTILMVYLLKRMDDQWQGEALVTAAKARVKNTGCWLVNQCPPELRANCTAYAHPEIACWQFYRQGNSGFMLEKCLDCQVFRGAPVPASI
jgi:hypothetical protein